MVICSKTVCGIKVLPEKLLVPILAATALLFGCDSNTPVSGLIETGTATDSGIDFQLPEKIRTSLAVDFDQVSGIANVNGRSFQMARDGERFIATVPGVPANSDVSIDLLFNELLLDGRTLNLARTESRTFRIGSADDTVNITEEEFIYDFDDDNDQISNIAERNDNTDPFTPENAGTRTITIEFTLPLRIEDPDITLVTTLIADVPRPRTSPPGTFVQASALISTLNTIDIDVRLNQLFQGQEVLVARAIAQVQPGTQNRVIRLSDSEFDFSIDNDIDGILNIDELQSGTNPFIAE